jgi:chemotaxis protein CheD
MEQIVVGMAECRVGDTAGQLLTTYALGSCIALTVYDPVLGIGGLVHFMLPDSSIDPERAVENPSIFADTAISLLLRILGDRGAVKRRLVLHAAGGASMMGKDRIFEIGRRNYEALRRELARAGLSLAAESIGGAVARNLRLDIGTGRIWLWEGGSSLYGGEPENTSADCR